MLEKHVNADCAYYSNHTKISASTDSFTAALSSYDYFGISTCSLGDVNGDTFPDVAIGAATFQRGAVYILFLNPDASCISHQKIAKSLGGFTGVLADEDYFGNSLATVGELNDNLAIAVGSYKDDDGSDDAGSVYILFLDSNGITTSHQKISSLKGSFTGILSYNDYFGISLGAADLNADLTMEIMVGAQLDDDGGENTGAVYILFLNSTGHVLSHQKISASLENIDLTYTSEFGSSVGYIGDLNDNLAIVIGAYKDGDGGDWKGAVYILYLEASAVCLSYQKISNTQGQLTANLDASDNFGFSVASIPDLNYDGVPEIAVGAHRDDEIPNDSGAIYIIFLSSVGICQFHLKISATVGGFTGVLSSSDLFGSSVTSFLDVNGDGTSELLIGAYNQGGIGSVYILYGIHGKLFMCFVFCACYPLSFRVFVLSGLSPYR